MAGTVTTTILSRTDHTRITVEWTADAADGSVPQTDILASISGMTELFGRITEVAAEPGTPAPTDNYDIELVDAEGMDVLGGAGKDRDASNPERFVPIVGGIRTPAWIAEEELTFSLTGNSVNSAQGTVVIYVAREAAGEAADGEAGPGLKLITGNVLETGTVTVTGEDTDYPKERLWDRDANAPWKYTTSAATLTIEAAQASNPAPVDILIVEGHNFSGKLMAWRHSDDGLSWTDAADPWSQDGPERIVKRIASPVTASYWRLVVADIESPEAAEVVMGLRALGKPCRWPGPGQEGREPNVIEHFSKPGHRWASKRGEERWFADYDLQALTGSERATLEECLEEIDHVGNFYIYDHEGTLRHVQLVSPVVFTPLTADRVSARLSVKEVL